MNWKEQLEKELGKLICHCKVYNDGECPRINATENFISTEIIEKLIDDIPDKEPCCGHPVENLKQQLKIKWLQ